MIFSELVPNTILNVAIISLKHCIEFMENFFRNLSRSIFLNDNSPFLKCFRGRKNFNFSSLNTVQVRSEVINVYFDETEELSSKTYLFHLSPTIVFHNLLNIPVTFLLEVCYIHFIKYSNHYIKTNITALISGML